MNAREFDVFLTQHKSLVARAATRNGLDLGDAVNTLWLVLREHGASRWGAKLEIELRRQRLGRRSVTHACWPTGEDGELIDLAGGSEQEELESWRVGELDEATEVLLDQVRDGGTAGLAVKRRVTRRRAQQIVAAAAERAAQGDLFSFGVRAAKGGV